MAAVGCARRGGRRARLARLAGRQSPYRWYFLLVGAVLLAWNPYSLLEPGFQLSFGAVGPIFLLVPRIEAWLTGYPVPRGPCDGACGLDRLRG